MPDVHEHLREAAPAPTTTPDFEELWTRGRRRRWHARGGAVVGALTVIAAAIVVVPGLFDDAPRPDVDIVDAPSPLEPVVPADAGWTQIAPSPLSPRKHANAFWTGEEVLVIGGSTEICPPDADCVGLPLGTAYADVTPSDGAAWDPVTDTWRPLEDAPIPVGVEAEGAMVGGTLYLWVPGGAGAEDPRFLAYAVGDDRWEQLPLPRDLGEPWMRLVAAEGRVVAYPATHESGVAPDDAVEGLRDLVFDTTSTTWTALPRDPFEPSYDRSMVWTGDELVLLALSLVDQPNSTEPNLYRAAGYDFETGAWTRLADSEVVGWDPAWFWVGGRIVNPSPGSSDGGDTNNWGRPYPHGGMYDLATDTWEALPPGPSISEDTPVDLPPEPYGYGFIAVAGGEYAVASGGWLLHVPTGTWQALAPPDGAPAEGMATVWAGDRLFLWGGGWFDGDTPYGLLATGWTYVPRPTTAPTRADVAGPTRTHSEPTSEAQSVTDTDRDLADRFIAFALDPGPDTAGALPFAPPTVYLGLADELRVERSVAELADEEAWVIVDEGFRAYTGPFSALEYLRGHVVEGSERPEDFGRRNGEVQINVGPHPHCASPPFPAPDEVSALRRVSIQPADDAVDTCLLWFTVDLFVNEVGEIEAVTLDLWEP